MNSEALFFQNSADLKLFFWRRVPGAISMLASALYQTVDGVFVGHFLGSTAFAAVNLAMPFVIINFSLADLIGVGAAVPISICLGKQEKEEANNIFTCAILMIVGTGVLIGALLFSRRAAYPSDGAEGEFAVAGGTVYAGLRPLFAGNHHRVCHGQFPADLRLYPGQHVPEYTDVRAERAAGISVSVRLWLGRLGCCSRHLYRHDHLRDPGAGSLCAKKRRCCVFADRGSMGK